jgi:hypothetical protein
MFLSPFFPWRGEDLFVNLLIANTPHKPLQTIRIAKVRNQTLQSYHSRQSALRFVLLEIFIGPTDDFACYGIEALSKLANVLLWSFANTYNQAKWEHVGRLAEFNLEVRLGTTPVIVSREHPFDAPTVRQVRGVFQGGESDILDHNPLVTLLAVDHDVVGLDIC